MRCPLVSSEFTTLRDELARLQKVITHLSEQNALSDDARRVLNRKRERELLRAAIDEDIAAEDWDAAMVLVKELAERFGYRSDAEEFRAHVASLGMTALDLRVDPRGAAREEDDA